MNTNDPVIQAGRWCDFRNLLSLLRNSVPTDDADFLADAEQFGHAVARHYLRTPSLQFPRNILQVEGVGEYLSQVNFSFPNATGYVASSSKPLPFVKALAGILPTEHFDLIILPTNHLLRVEPEHLHTALQHLSSALKPTGLLIMPIELHNERRFEMDGRVFLVKEVDHSDSLRVQSYRVHSQSTTTLIQMGAQLKGYALADTDLTLAKDDLNIGGLLLSITAKALSQ